MGNVLAIVHAVEADFAYRLVGAVDRLPQAYAPGRHPQHAASSGVETPVLKSRARVEYLDAGHRIRLLDAFYRLAHFIAARVAARGASGSKR